MKLIQKGAEADLYKKGNSLIKNRVKKSYRIKELDEEIRKTRTRREARLISEASRAGVNVPRVISKSDYVLELEFIDGGKLKEILNEKNCKGICKKIGEAVARLHKYGIIHGDLTTSNMILKDNRLFLIDFGLGFRSEKIEDMATDLHLLEEALESTHYKIADNAFKEVIKNYKFEKSKEVLSRMESVRLRGRYVRR